MKSKKLILELIRNVSYLILGQFGTKILTFVMVPLYTSVLTTQEYGQYDLIYSTIQLLIPLLTLNICESTLRFSIDNNDPSIMSISIKYLSLGSFLLILSILLLHQLDPNIFSEKICIYSLLLFISYALNNIFLYYSRGVNCYFAISLSGILSVITTLILNIVLLLYVKIGLDGYYIATISGVNVQTVLLLAVLIKKKKLNIAPIKKQLELNMLKYSTPMIANTISWWAINSLDRYMVLFFYGVAMNGVYSVAYKIPSLINVIQSVFNQAWTLTAVKSVQEDRDGSITSEIFEYYNLFMILGCSFVIASTQILSNILYSKEFYDAWIFVPWLTYSVLFSSLAAFVGGIFSAVKESKYFAKSSITGSVVNLILNIILLNTIGPVGAAIATFLAYFCIFIMRLKQSTKYIKMSLNWKRCELSYFVLLMQCVVWNIDMNRRITYCLQLLGIVVLIFLYKKVIINITNKALRKVHHRWR